MDEKEKDLLVRAFKSEKNPVQKPESTQSA